MPKTPNKKHLPRITPQNQLTTNKPKQHPTSNQKMAFRHTRRSLPAALADRKRVSETVQLVVSQGRLYTSSSRHGTHQPTNTQGKMPMIAIMARPSDGLVRRAFPSDHAARGFLKEHVNDSRSSLAASAANFLLLILVRTLKWKSCFVNAKMVGLPTSFSSPQVLPPHTSACGRAVTWK